MISNHPHAISIWFLIGLQFLIYGVLVFGAGIYDAYVPSGRDIQLADLHAAIWWGAIMFALGLFYTVRFRPRRES
ncbi:MAG: hypothetical protein LV479_11865 [Methylacidiphilales bacterium]|nr:hypothetical protein [Candidatus Methylacidiphilales bacterium]